MTFVRFLAGTKQPSCRTPMDASESCSVYVCVPEIAGSPRPRTYNWILFSPHHPRNVRCCRKYTWGLHIYISIRALAALTWRRRVKSRRTIPSILGTACRGHDTGRALKAQQWARGPETRTVSHWLRGNRALFCRFRNLPVMFEMTRHTHGLGFLSIDSFPTWRRSAEHIRILVWVGSWRSAAPTVGNFYWIRRAE